MKHSIGKSLPAGATTEVFTVPAGYVAEVSLLFITNHTATNKAVSAYWQHAHDPSHQIYIVQDKTINAKDFLMLTDATMVMQSGDSMHITTEAGGDFAVITTFDLRKETALYTFAGE